MNVIDQIVEAPHTYELLFAIRFLDAVGDRASKVRRMIDRLIRYVNSDRPTPVTSTDDEVMQLLDFTPYADASSRASFTTEAIAADLDRLASHQQPDGGWTVDYPSYSPAAALEWRGYVTVQAIAVLRGTSL